MKIIKEDGPSTISHKVISKNAILQTHSSAINKLVKEISKTYNISYDDAAFALSNTLNRISQFKTR
jgi:hypothetical protein